MELLTDGRIPPIGSAMKRSEVFAPIRTSDGIVIFVTVAAIAVPRRIL
jgi:hypothetical protein